MLKVLLAVGLLGQADLGGSRITATMGAVNVHRGQRVLSASPGVAVVLGDRLATSANGGAIWYYNGSAVVYLGGGCETLTELSGDVLNLTVTQGEVRVVASGDSQVRLRWSGAASDGRRGVVVEGAPDAYAAIDRGILRIQRSPGRTKFYCEQGQSRVFIGRPANASSPIATDIQLTAWQNEQGVLLSEGSQLVVSDTGQVEGPAPVNLQDWTLDPVALRLAQTLALRDQKRERETDDEEPESPPEEEDQPDAPDADAFGSQIQATAGISLALGGTSGSTSFGSSGALFSDAQQESVNLAFPGSIHLVTAQNSYIFSDVRLTAADGFPTTRQFWSIGLGEAPTSQVRTDFVTGTGLTPRTVAIPGFDAYIVQLDQYGVPDPAGNNPSSGQLGVAGLVGSTPQSPSIQGAAPLVDERAAINDRATFALGELAVGASGDNPVFDLRRSDQDRTIVKDPGGDDDKDVVTPNPDVTFTDTPDYKFFPQVPLPGVKVPTAFRNAPTFGGLTRSREDFLRKAAFTTLVAEQLHDYARRTGQTRFVVDGKIVDITGYRR